MTQNKKIAVTGGIGSGKSLFCDLLKEMGYPVFSCDEIYGELLREKSFLSRLKEGFPDCFQGETLNKKCLSERIFSDSRAKKTLESLAHPIVMRRLFAKMKGAAIAFAEVPLLFEGGYEVRFDAVIAIVRSKEERIRALKSRSGLTEEEILRRMNSQLDPALLPQKNCLILENDGSKEDLKEKAEDILKKIL